MKGKTISWTGIVVLVSCLALPAIAAQGASSEESRPRPNDSGDRTRPDAAERWKRLDQDNDGRISRSEWPRSQQAFGRIDADKDGFLTEEELRLAAREFREKHRNRFREMDTNGDGNISRSEWRGKAEKFNRLDANRDGVLSRDELRTAGNRHGAGSLHPGHNDKTTL